MWYCEMLSHKFKAMIAIARTLDIMHACAFVSSCMRTGVADAMEQSF